MASYKDIKSLGDAIDAFLAKNGLKDQADIQQVIAEWPRLMGKPIASNTEKIWFERGRLCIKMSSPIWKNELQMARLKIRHMINERLGRELVKEVKIS